VEFVGFLRTVPGMGITNDISSVEKQTNEKYKQISTHVGRSTHPAGALFQLLLRKLGSFGFDSMVVSSAVRAGWM
jgi:hypothetical protein